ncbi:unnamed protein product, partial [Schistocephalus solidus]|uniref:DHC_N1 domain-containing protein n=1 Tax=Schistocephalus solidus TaxID=70667 RepID=A0A183TFC6_SCHSO
IIARTYTRVALHVVPLPLTDKQAEECGIRRYLYAVRCRDDEVRFFGETDQPSTWESVVSTLEVGSLALPTLDANINAITKVYQCLLSYYSQKFGDYDEEAEEEGAKRDAAASTIAKVRSISSVTESKQGLQRSGSALTLSSADSIEDTPSGGNAPASTEMQRLRDEFGVNLHKFQSVLLETSSALKGVFNLPMPDFELPTMQAVLDGLDRDLYEKFALLINSWDQVISDVLTKLDEPRPVTVGPLEEIDYWRYRGKILTSVNESLRTKEATHIIELWNAANPDLPKCDRVAKIRALMAEAKDNARFLLLVERHFKNVQFGHSFNVVADTIPAMLQSLRLIWTISRGYNKDERMGPLLQKIAWALYDRVIRVMDIATLFSRSVRGILRETRSAVRMLTIFETTYMHERQRVEATSQDNRWEFDRKLLFGKIHYVTRILKNILDMAQCAREFYRMFGPELKNITGDSKSLTEVLILVDNLFNSFTDTNMPCPFLTQNEKVWNRLLERFEDKVHMIDAKAKNFVNDYFAHIRGANNAFNLLEKFKSVKARAAISCLLLDKYRDVLRSLGKELQRVELKFKEMKTNPPIAHFLPPVSGAISWARLTLNVVKVGIVRFLRSQPDIFEEEEGKAVRQRYIKLAHALREYEAEMHGTWENDINMTLSSKLNQSILFKNPATIEFHKV